MTFGLSQKQTAQTLNGYWSLICYKNLLTGKQDCLTVTDESQTVSLEFKDNGNIGTMSGHTTTVRRNMLSRRNGVSAFVMP